MIRSLLKHLKQGIAQWGRANPQGLPTVFPDNNSFVKANDLAAALTDALAATVVVAAV